MMASFSYYDINASGITPLS